MTMLLLILFVVGYACIIAEQKIGIDKAAIALLTGVLCWIVSVLSSPDPGEVSHQLQEQMSSVSGIVFFLLGAMTIVELIDLYDGFQQIIALIRTTNKRTFLLIITLLAFFLSAILDNLTTTIVMGSIIRKLLPEKTDRLWSLGMVVVAANAGGCWSPIGDVTTTMLWIGNQLTPVPIILKLFVPSLVATLVPMFWIMLHMKGSFRPLQQEQAQGFNTREQRIILYSGLGLLLSVPVVKVLTHLPPFMGMLMAVGIVWVISETLHKRRNDDTGQSASIFSALERIDMPSLLFFTGILLAVGSLESAGLLQQAAVKLSQVFSNDRILLMGIGLLSAVFDNVPLVAAVQGMYDLQHYPTDSFFWVMLAFCSGTGGSILIIGSAAGVAAMGIEDITFSWYLRHISLPALAGFFAGALTCVLLSS